MPPSKVEQGCAQCKGQCVIISGTYILTNTRCPHEVSSRRGPCSVKGYYHMVMKAIIACCWACGLSCRMKGVPKLCRVLLDVSARSCACMSQHRPPLLFPPPHPSCPYIQAHASTTALVPSTSSSASTSTTSPPPSSSIPATDLCPGRGCRPHPPPREGSPTP